MLAVPGSGGATGASHGVAVRARRALLVGIGAAAVLAVLGGLARLGWHVPGGFRAAEHGPLLVLGVFGSIIALERAVAHGRAWAYLAPLAGVVGAILALAGARGSAAWLSFASSVALVAVNVALVRRQPAAHGWLMALGAVTLAAGTFTFALGRPVFEVVPCWLVFFVLTIAAERLEMSRLAPMPRWATRAFVVLGALVAALAPLALFVPGPAVRVLGAAFALMGLWQLRFDLARRTVRGRGLPRYVAIAVLAGAVWLTLCGVGLVLMGLPAAGPHYDGLLHAVFVGYVLSMVFAHAPIILPAVARLDVPYHPVLYAPVALLHLGLVLRCTGDAIGSAELRSHGGLCNALALALFLAATVFARVRRGSKTRAVAVAPISP